MSGTILVTGSAGFLGVVLCAELRARGYAVRGYDLANGDDILDRARLQIALEGCAACVHLAAVADLYQAELDVPRCEQINVEGTRAVATACDLTGARLLYASTCCVYGNNGVDRCDESAPAAPTEHYARSKLAGEALVSLAGPEATSLRLATFYGPGMRESLATSVFIRRALSGAPLELHGDGHQTRCFTHVQDIARGIAAVLESPVRPPCVNVASDEERSVLELAELVRELTGSEAPLRFVPDRLGQIRRSAIDSGLLREMGWSPRWTLRDGLAQCLSALRGRPPS